jgi:nucleoside-diphosphate-sugar epimerase
LAGVRLAKLAKQVGVKKFIFASSCSVYGQGGGKPKTELDEVNPLTEYAKSKINSEVELSKIASPKFIIKCLRFSTACGFSPRLRLDIVLNDFVAASIVKKHINILSDGNPWRPIIHVLDMARAIHWSIEDSNDAIFQILNVGSINANFQVKELAEAVRTVNPTVEISINKKASPDKRTYKVDFSAYNNIAQNYQPTFSLEDSVKDLIKNIELLSLNGEDVKSSEFIRLKSLKESIKNNLIDSNLKVI